MSTIMSLAHGVRRYIGIAVAVRLAITLTLIGQAWYVAAILHHVLEGDGVAEQRGALIGVGTLVVIRLALVYVSELLAQVTAAATKSALRSRAFGKLAELGPVWTSGERTGEMKATMVESIESLESYYGSFLPALGAVFVTPLAAVVVLGAHDVWLAMIVAAFVVASVTLPMLWVKVVERRSNDRMSAYLGLGATFLDTLQGLVTLKTFGATARRRRELAELSDRLITQWNREMAVALLSHSVYALGIIGGTGTAVAVAAIRTANGGLGVGTLFLALLLSAEALRAVATLATSFHTSYEAASGAERLIALFAATSPAPSNALSSPNPRGRPSHLASSFAFDNVWFGYDPATPVLRGVSLYAAAGETVAVVGPSGSGKTTLTSLLLRFADAQAGSVRVGGRDVRALPAEELRSMISVVAQDTYLFAGTVAENLALARPGAIDADIVAAAKVANAHDFIIALPQGYDTQIGERGLLLSGGQRQRLAIARAVLADAPILVLDEATASVDAATEAAIQSALDRLTVGRTTLVIAHRLSTVRAADRIVVLDAGEIVESGTHRDLLAAGGSYRRLVSAQEVV